eukprot:1282166-Amphidinium_carterae.1
MQHKTIEDMDGCPIKSKGKGQVAVLKVSHDARTCSQLKGVFWEGLEWQEARRTGASPGIVGQEWSTPASTYSGGSAPWRFRELHVSHKFKLLRDPSDRAVAKEHRQIELSTICIWYKSCPTVYLCSSAFGSKAVVRATDNWKVSTRRVQSTFYENYQ